MFEEMEAQAKARIAEAYTVYGDSLYMGHSGGKDSAVVYWLAKQVIPNLKVFHTTKELSLEDKPYPNVPFEDATFLYELAQKQELYMVPPEKMQEVIARFGLRCQIDGTRRDECERHDRSSTYYVDGQDLPRDSLPVSITNGLFGLAFVYPIYDWTTEQVWQFIRERGIEVSKSYNR